VYSKVYSAALARHALVHHPLALTTSPATHSPEIILEKRAVDMDFLRSLRNYGERFPAIAASGLQHDKDKSSQQLVLAVGNTSCATEDVLEFRHDPLNLKGASIRLVEVLPLDASGLVQCKIRHATTDDRYTCVSYVWGSPNETHLIRMNGQPFRVRSNIGDFLSTVASRIASETVVSGEHSLLDWEEAAGAL
jgi:hypothetical protein